MVNPLGSREAVPPAAHSPVGCGTSNSFPMCMDPGWVSVPRVPHSALARGDPSCPGTPWQRDSTAWHWCLLCPRRSRCWGCFPRGSDVRGLLAMLMGC